MSDPVPTECVRLKPKHLFRINIKENQIFWFNGEQYASICDSKILDTVGNVPHRRETFADAIFPKGKTIKDYRVFFEAIRMSDYRKRIGSPRVNWTTRPPSSVHVRKLTFYIISDNINQFILDKRSIV